MIDSNKILVVDLDGTLIRSDMLQETFWSAFSLDWKVPFKALAALLSGKAQLKEYLNRTSDVEVNTLPYNKSVINYIKQFRQKGGRSALVTASNHVAGKKISNHLGFFDEVYGSTSTLNLKGKNKADFLNSRFGLKNFNYIGNSYADIPVWKNADKAITINADQGLKRACNKANYNCEHLKDDDKNPSLYSFIKLLRPHQWLKNILVFLPMLVSHQITIPNFFECFTAFIAFNFIASSVYIVNDLLDLNIDRAHPRKKDRLIASGIIPITNSMIIAILFFIFGISVALLLSQFFLFILLAYYALTFIYSLVLKKKKIVDIFTLAIFYTIRIVGGGIASEIKISFWLLFFSMFFFFSLAAIKRLSEIVDLKKNGKSRIINRNYQITDLSIITMIAIIAGFISVLVMTLYVYSPSATMLYSTPKILWGVNCILLYWLIRMVFMSYHGKMDDDPIIFAIKDRVTYISFIFIAMFILLGLRL